MTQNPDIDNLSDDEFWAMVEEADRVRQDERGNAIIAYIGKNFRNDSVAGLEALLIGNPDTLRPLPAGSEEPFWSAKAQQQDLLFFLLHSFIAKLEESESYSLWTSGGPDFDRDVARVFWSLGEGGAQHAVRDEIPAKVVEIARMIRRSFVYALH